MQDKIFDILGKWVIKSHNKAKKRNVAEKRFMLLVGYFLCGIIAVGATILGIEWKLRIHELHSILSYMLHWLAFAGIEFLLLIVVLIIYTSMIYFNKEKK